MLPGKLRAVNKQVTRSRWFFMPVAALALTVIATHGCSRAARKTAESAKTPARVPTQKPLGFLMESQIRELRIKNAKLGEEIHSKPEETARNTPERFRPADPSSMRHAVITVTFASDKTGEQQVYGSDFALTYETGAGKQSAPCLGLGLKIDKGDLWIYGGKNESGTSMPLVFDKPDGTQDRLLLFLVPKDIKECALEVTPPGQAAVVVAQFTLPQQK